MVPEIRPGLPTSNK